MRIELPCTVVAQKRESGRRRTCAYGQDPLRQRTTPLPLFPRARFTGGPLRTYDTAAASGVLSMRNVACHPRSVGSRGRSFVRSFGWLLSVACHLSSRSLRALSRSSSASSPSFLVSSPLAASLCFARRVSLLSSFNLSRSLLSPFFSFLPLSPFFSPSFPASSSSFCCYLALLSLLSADIYIL